MGYTICSLPYINRIKDNVLAIKKEELKTLYEDLQSSDIIIPIASGRSKHAMNIPLSQLMASKGESEKILIYPEGPAFPWGSFYEVASVLEKRYESKKILFLFNSGSGTTQYPWSVACDLDKYIEEKKPKNFKIDAITSNPNSPIGKIARKHGNVLQLKGKEIFPKSEKYSEIGIMRDMFELGSCFLLQILVKALYYNSDSEIFYELAEEEFLQLGKMIDDVLISPFYTSAIDRLETRCHVFGNAKGSGEEVIKATLIRLAHVKKAVGEEVYFSNPPMPRAGDFQLSVSYSGTTSSVVEVAKRFRELRGYQFSVIANKETPLEKVSDYTLILPETSKLGEPRMFYMRALFCLSPLPIELIKRFHERGINLSEDILTYYHSVTE